MNRTYVVVTDPGTDAQEAVHQTYDMVRAYRIAKRMAEIHGKPTGVMVRNPDGTLTTEF